MKLRTLTDKSVKNKTVLLKVDFNTPLKTVKGDTVVADDTRIRVILPTIHQLIKNNCKIVIVSHLGRPNGRPVQSLRLNPVAVRLQKLLHHPVKKIDSLIGPKADKAIAALKPQDVLMLENTRFHPGEQTNDPSLSRALAKGIDVFINDGFAVSHRKHASVAGVAQHLTALAGPHLVKEVAMLEELTQAPARPFVAIIGGAKISDKVGAIKNLLRIADIVLVGGGVANNFLKAEGLEVFKSYMQDTVADDAKRHISYVGVAEDLIEDTKSERVLLHGYIPLPKIVYPSDVVAAPSLKQADKHSLIDLTCLNGTGRKQNLMYLDIGPNTRRLYADIINEAKTVFWNGPMGAFETPQFAAGTRVIATAIAHSQAKSIVGGGDTIRAINHFKLQDEYTYVSAAGGATLDFLAGKTLPGLEPLKR